MAVANFLGRYYDPALKLPKVDNREQLEREEIERITSSLTVVVIAGSIPRRLGIEATNEELALDKKRARQAAYALNQALRGWSRKSPKLDATDDLRLAGVHLDWEVFRGAHIVKIQDHLKLVVTWSLRHDESRWGKSAVVRLENEAKWFDYALRD